MEAFCTKAEETLDGLEAFGKEPVLDDAWLAELAEADAPFYFSTDSLEEAGELDAEERHRQLRLNLRAQPVEEMVLPDAEAVAEVLDLAHAEEVEKWQQAISQAMADHKSLCFTKLLELSELKPTELLIGLLLGQWTLQQKTFYGEINVSG